MTVRRRPTRILVAATLTTWAVVSAAHSPPIAVHAMPARVVWSVHGRLPTASIASISFIDRLHGWIAAGSQYLKTTDGGNTWDLLPYPTGVQQFIFTDVRHGYAVGSAIMRTDDGGRTWIPVTMEKNTPPSAASLSVPSPTVLYAANAAGGGVYRSADAGRTWRPILHDVGVTHIAAPSVNDVWEAGTAMERINGMMEMVDALRHTKDAGVTWTTTTITGSIASLAFPSPAVGYVAQGALIKHTENGGASWTTEYPFGAPKSVNVGAIGGAIGVAQPILDMVFKTPRQGTLLTVTGILDTQDGGKSWHAVPRLQGEGDPFVVGYRPDGTRYAVAPIAAQLLPGEGVGAAFLDEQSMPQPNTPITVSAQVVRAAVRRGDAALIQVRASPGAQIYISGYFSTLYVNMEQQEPGRWRVMLRVPAQLPDSYIGRMVRIRIDARRGTQQASTMGTFQIE